MAYWEGGSDHALAKSPYYGANPLFIKCRRWPCFEPDLSPVFGPLPARDRYNGIDTCTDSQAFISENDFCRKEGFQVFSSHRSVTITIYLKYFKKPASVAIIDLCGANTASFTDVNSDKILWNHDGCADGLYFVRARSGNMMPVVKRVFLTRR